MRTDEEILDEAYSTDYLDTLYKLKREAKSKNCKLAIDNIIKELLYESSYK